MVAIGLEDRCGKMRQKGETWGTEEECNLMMCEEGDGPASIELDIVNDMVRFRKHPIKFLEIFAKHFVGVSWRDYNDYIGPRIFRPAWRENLVHSLVNQPMMDTCINQMVDRRMQLEADWTLSDFEKSERRAMYKGWILDIVRELAVENLPTLQEKRVVQFMYYIVAQLFSRAYHQGVNISRSDILRLKTKARELSQKKQGMLLLPSHKSHIDYMAFVFLYFRIGLTLPVTIAGDNLNLPFVGDFLRGAGAMFIRRGSWSKDPLYVNFCKSTIASLLQQGYTVQCFIEGTRSRTGKLLPPKYGFLKLVLDMILDGTIEDVWVIPASTQYDKVFEADTYATELLGREKRKESFFSFLKSSKIMSLRLGRVDIKFGEIWSLKEFITHKLSADFAVPLAIPVQLSPESSVRLLHSIGYHVLAGINKASRVMPSALLGTVLLTTRKSGLLRDELLHRVRWLIMRTREKKANLCLPKDFEELTMEDIGSVVDNAVNVLGPGLISIENKKVVMPVYRAVDEFRLSYYRNQTVHLFIQEAVTCVALVALAEPSFEKRVAIGDICAKGRFLLLLLSEEFVYREEHGAPQLMETLIQLEAQNILRISGDEVSISEKELENGMQLVDFYCYLLWPYVDGYWVVGLTLLIMPPGDSIRVKDFLRLAQTIAHSLYKQGSLIHSEALNQQMLQFALAHFTSKGLVIKRKTQTGEAEIALASKYVPEVSSAGVISVDSPLYRFTDEIHQLRNKPRSFESELAVTTNFVKLCQQLVSSLSYSRL